jgi:hypothetical protein
MDQIEYLNALIERFDEFRVQSFDSSTMLLFGCWDLTYHHSVEVEFIDVSYINCATFFHMERLRLATPEERRQLTPLFNGDTDEKSASPPDTLFCIESDGRTFFIAAQGLRVRRVGPGA